MFNFYFPNLCLIFLSVSFTSFPTLYSITTSSKTEKSPSVVHAMVIYAQDSNDHYPFPSESIRDSIYARLSRFYGTLSYGAHKISFNEATNNGEYFVSDYPASHYKKHYNRKKHVRGFGMFNEEILDKVKAQKGDQYFNDVDMIVMVGTDGGRGWYAPGVNATGYGMLGVNFSAGRRTFGKSQGQGGITVEIGSDIGTKDPDDDRLITLQEIYWNFVHEYGHWLKLGHHSCKLGVYSLMCKELKSNSRMPEFGPPPLDIFHIMKLGWIDESDSSRVKIITSEIGNTTVTLNQIRSPNGLILARIDLPQTHEKLYLSYHRQNSNTFDGVYMGEGLLIWYTRGSFIDLKCANASEPHGRDHLDEGKDLGGLETDFFNINNRFQFTLQYNLRSNKGDGHTRNYPAAVLIQDFRQSGDQFTFKAYFEISSNEINTDSN